MGSGVRYVYWVIDGLLAGRPGPVEVPWDPGQFAAAGLQAIVSLNSQADPEAIASAGLRHHSLPLPPILPMTGALQDMILHRLEEVLATVHAEMSAGQPTLVHCHAGKDRTGLALTAYLVRYHGLDVEEAIERVRSANPIAMSAPGYEATARRFAEQEGKDPMADLKVAAIQMDAQVGAVAANLAHAAPLVKQAAEQGAQLIVLPELFSTGYEYTDRNYTLPERVDGLTGTWIVETAQRLGVHLVGSFPAWIDGKTYIVAMLAAPDGRKWIYHKIHVAMWENCYFDRGGEPVIADTDLGRIGLLICWDEVYADLARAYRGRVDLLCIPSSPPTFVGTLEDKEGNVLARIDNLGAFGRTMDMAEWFQRAQVAHARNAGVPVVYAARCGSFHSPIPYGEWLLLALGTRDALHVLRTAGSRFRVRCPMMGRSCILDAEGERVASTGQDGEAVLVATVEAGAPDPAALPPPPRGTALIAGVPRYPFWFDGSMISLGSWYRQRHIPRR